MDKIQRKMSDRFSSFISDIKDLDYQIGITTTDVSGPLPFGSGFAMDGRLVTYAGSTTKILTPTTADADKLFKNTIRRDETIDCKNRSDGKCPSSNEQPLKAINMAIGERSAANAGFFRDGVDLAVVVLSDEDEMSDGTSSSRTLPSQVVNTFKSAFSNAKRFMVHGIIIRPGDDDCLEDERKSTFGGGFFGTNISELASLTGGRTYSICDNDYGRHLSSISSDVRKLVSTFELQHVPLDPTKVEVTLTPASTLAWRIEGKLLIFTSPPPSGTRIGVRYVPKP